MTIEMRDCRTAWHQYRVANLVSCIATAIGLSQGQIDNITMAALVHDIGKICVPVQILNKPGQLDELELGAIRMHPQAGYVLLERMQVPWAVGQAVLQHHERMDGSGYPSGLSGEYILLESRILALADVVEAMASHRPYRQALGIDGGLEEVVQKKGILYDSQIADVCIELLTAGGFKFESTMKSAHPYE